MAMLLNLSPDRSGHEEKCEAWGERDEEGSGWVGLLGLGMN